MNKKIFFSFFSVVLITSCVTETVDRSPSMKFSDAAVISVQNPNVSITSASSFAWLPEAMRFYNDNRLDSEAMKSMINDEIIENLSARKMKFVDSPKDADFSIAYTAALESSLGDDEIIKRFGLLPGHAQVPAADTQIEKGSLIIYVFENKTSAVIWRSAAQVGVKFDTQLDERKANTRRVIAEMFQTFPADKSAVAK